MKALNTQIVYARDHMQRNQCFAGFLVRLLWVDATVGQRLCPFRNGIECDGRGVCAGGVCSCQFGYGGGDCSLKCATNSLLIPCSGHGQCGETGVCICDDAWAGEICAQKCPGGESGPCSFRGECLSDGKIAYCVCQRAGDGMIQHYEGVACHVPVYNESSRVEQQIYDQPSGQVAMLALPLILVIILVCVGLYFHEDHFFSEVAYGCSTIAQTLILSYIELVISLNIAFFNLGGFSHKYADDRSEVGSDSEAGDDAGVGGPMIELENLDSRKELEKRIKAAYTVSIFLRDKSSPKAIQEGFLEGLRMLGLEGYLSVPALARVKRQLMRRRLQKSAVIRKKIMAAALRRRRDSMDPSAFLKEQVRSC